MTSAKSRPWILTYVIAATGLSSGLVGGEEAPKRQVSAERIHDHIEFLASDELAGRDSGEPGLEVAAEYIANRYQEYGLEPAGDHGTYFHLFSVARGARLLGRAGATLLVKGDREMIWNVGTDVEAFGFADRSSTIEDVVDAPVVYAGYGITTTEEERKQGLVYDDYAGLDVKGKVPIVLRYTPRLGKPNDPFGGLESPHASFLSKLRNARKHGAHGVIFLTPPNRQENSIYGIARRGSPRQPTLPAIVARRAVVERLLALEGKRLLELVEETDAHLKPQSFALESVSIRFSTGRRYLRLRNVVGRLKGSDSDLDQQSVLIGAHYDHIGRFGSQVSHNSLGQIHNGADDNASGVAGVLELARLLSSEPRSGRSFLFACFSAEEIGLLGSRHWVQSPRRFVTTTRVRARQAVDLPHSPSSTEGATSGTKAAEATREWEWKEGTVLESTGRFSGTIVEAIDPSGVVGWVDAAKLQQIAGPEPLSNIVAMINLDMIGNSGPGGTAKVIGADTSEAFPALLEKLKKREDFPLKVTGRGIFSGASDHMNFVRYRIPVLFFFTGPHKRYNTPEDDTDTVNIEGEARLVNFIWKTLRQLATLDERPRWNPDTVVPAHGQHGKPKLGVELDPAFRGKGVLVAAVLPDSVASKAGVRAGDVILRVADEKISGFESLVAVLDEDGHGAVTITVRRDNAKLDLKAEFPAPRGRFRVRFGSVPDYAFEEKGVRFEDIRDGTPAAKAGVQPGDILVRWDGKDVDDVEEWTRLLGGHQPGDEVAIEVLRRKKIVKLKVCLEGR